MENNLKAYLFLLEGVFTGAEQCPAQCEQFPPH